MLRPGDPVPKVKPGAFSGQRQWWKNLRGSALLLCMQQQCTAGRSPWGKQVRGMWMSVWLSSFILGFSRVCFLYCIIFFIRDVLLCCCNFVFCVLVVWFSCQYLPSDWLERLVWGRLFVSRRVSPQKPGWRALCVLFQFNVLFYCMFAPGPVQYFMSPRHDLAC